MAYCFACWHFFYDRVLVEEAMLIKFFGSQYLEYQKRVPRTGVPFVPGFQLPPAWSRSPSPTPSNEQSLSLDVSEDGEETNEDDELSLPVRMERIV